MPGERTLEITDRDADAFGGGGASAARRARGWGDAGEHAGRRWPVAVWAVAFVAFLVQSPGRMTFDTKLGVDTDPVGFYQRLWHLWNPLEWFGGLQDQYIGYAFPMGAYYLVAHLLHVPVWIAERLWMSLLVGIAFWGMVRLAEAVGVGSRPTRLLAGAVFALWPTFTILVGSTSAAVLPGVLAPWAVLPLTATRSARAAAARSGLVVLCMGGVNAASTLAALLLPGFYILTRPTPVRRRAALVAWWVAAVVPATLWWLVPLLYQGRYGFNFLPYIEQAANTTRTMSAPTLLRGSGDWVAYLALGRAWLPAGWTLVTSPWAVAAASLAAAAGVAGLACRDLPEGAWLRWTVGTAALVALAGYPGPFGGLFHGQVASLLNGPVAPLRNIYKFEPAVAAVLALAAAHLLAKVAAAVLRPEGGIGRAGLRWSAGLLAAAVLAGLALPYLTGRILQPGAFTEVPGYWRQAAAFLHSHSPSETALVVPVDSHGLYSWGQPIDEPLEPLARSPWVQRDLVPFSGGGVRDLLDGAERAIDSGLPVPGLAEYLGRAGVRYVVVRNDLDPGQLDYVPPQLVHRTLQESGFTRAAAFGPTVLGGRIGPGTALQVAAIVPRYPAVEIFRSGGGNQPGGPAAVLPADRTTLVSGGPASLLQLAGQGRLAGRPVVIGGQTEPARRGTGLSAASQEVTDGLRRADTVFGLPMRNTSYTYTATETNPSDDPHGHPGGPPRQLLPEGAAGHQTVAVLTGAARVTASSYGSWLWQVPQGDPVNAFDGDPATAWVEGQPGSAVGQWVQIDFDRPLRLSGPLQVVLPVDAGRAVPTRLVVTTAAGRAVTDVRAAAGPQPLGVPAGTTSHLRITIAAARGGSPGGPGAGISDVLIPGVKVTRFLQPAQDPAGPAPSFSFQRDTFLPLGLPGAPPEPALDRTFSTPALAAFRFSATAAAVPGPALDALLSKAADRGRRTLRIRADSTFGDLPSLSPRNLLDGSDATGWVAAGPSAALHLQWNGARRIDSLQLTAAGGGIAAAPTRVRISAPSGVREMDLPASGELRFSALVTDRLDIGFPQVTRATTVNPLTGRAEQLPVGLAEVRIPALTGLVGETIEPQSRISLPCGQGPAVTLDGRTYATSVTATADDLIGLRPVPVRLCTPDGAVHLAAGRHWLSSPGSTGPLAIAGLGLAASDAPASGAPRTMRVGGWGAEHRTVEIGPGPVTYLELHQAANPGWTATLYGHPLAPVTLDGWQQGYVVPAGAGGEVTLSFAPTRSYRWLLAVSAVAVVALIVLAAVPASRSRHRMEPPMARGGPGVWVFWGGAAAVTLLLVVIGGPLAVAVPLLVLAARWRPLRDGLPWLAFAAMTVAGAFALTGLRHGAAAGNGSFGGPAQAAALVGLTAALVPRLAGGAPEPDGATEPAPRAQPLGRRRRRVRPVLVGVGICLAAAGMLVRYYAAPRLAVAPRDISDNAVLVADGATYFDSGSLRTVTGSTLTEDVTIRGELGMGDANTAVWDQIGTLEDRRRGVRIDAISERLAFDRRSGRLRRCCGTSIDAGARVDSTGIGIFWPIGVAKRTYQVYDTSTGRTWPMTYAGTRTVSGIKAYRFVQHIPETKVGLVPRVPATVLGLHGVKGAVDAVRYYRADIMVSVDPRTGVELDRDQRVVSTLRGQDGAGRLVAVDMDLKASAATRRWLADRARSGALGITVLRTVAPLTGIALGVALMAAAFLPARRRAAPGA